MTRFENFIIRIFQKALSLYKAIIVSFIIVLGATMIYNRLVTPQYVSQASFFMASSKGSSLGSLGNYASMLGLGGIGGKSGESMILDILRSRRIKLHIAEQFRDQISPMPLSIPHTMRKLKLAKNLNFSYVPSKFTITISYQNEDPKLAHDVLVAYLEYLNAINQELELSAEKELIKILDHPSRPLGPSTPNKILNLLKMTLLLIGIWGSVICYLVMRTPPTIRKKP